MTVSTGTVPTRDSCRRTSYAPDKHVAHMELVPMDKVAPPGGPTDAAEQPAPARAAQGGATLLAPRTHRRLRDKDSALAELDKQIADAFDGEEFDEDIMGALDCHEKIVKAVSRLRSALNARASVGPTVVEANQSSRPRTPGLLDTLPKLLAPAFSSENRELPGFWEHYDATIHRHPKLTDIETFKLYLAGAMNRAIEGTRLTEGNYNVAVKVPTDGYGRKDVGDEYTGSLLATEPFESSSPLSRLRDVYEQTQFRTSCLDSHGMPSAKCEVVSHRQY
ncbi:hypothetical protein MTO96_007824 [Rhipicephalus appendiculatus]